jgi:hypothetical protein
MPENRLDKIDKAFKDPLQSFQQTPTIEVWEKIELRLNSDKTRRAISRYHAVFIILCFISLLSVSLGVLFFRDYRNKKGQMSANKVYTRSSSPGPIQKSVNIFHERGRAIHGMAISAGKVGEYWAPAYSPYEDVRRADPGSPVGTPANTQLLADRIRSFARNTPPERISALQRWSFTGYFSQEFAGYNLTDHDSTSANGKEIEKKERSVFSASAGLLLNYRLKGKWIIQSGLVYSWSNSIMDPSTTYAVKDNNGDIKFKVNTVSGYGFLTPSSSAPPNVGDSAMIGRSYSRLRYLTIPIMASYGFIVKKFTMLAGAGISFNFLTNATVQSGIRGTFYNAPESVVTLYGLQKINYGLILKTELQYPVSPHWSLSLLACFKNTLTPINTHTSLSTYPYNVGIGLGVKHAL